MEDLETWAALEFHGVAYVVTVQVRRQTLLLQVELAAPPADAWGGCWTGHFPAADVEALTRQTGNSKRFAVFVRMLLSALARRSAAVFVDLLTAADLELYRKRKLGAASPPTGAEAREGDTGKRYLILTYAVEFDRVHYPLPLERVQSPSPEMLQRTIRRLRQALAATPATPAGARPAEQQAGSSQLEAENAALREENCRLQNRLAQCGDGDAAGHAAVDLQRELQTSMEENKELISLYEQLRADSAAEKTQLRAQIKQLQLASLEHERLGHSQATQHEQERRETRRKMDSDAAVQEALAQLRRVKTQLEDSQLQNRELLRQLAVARAASRRQAPASSSRASSGAPARRARPPAGAAAFAGPFRASASQYGASEDEDAGARPARRSRPPAFRRFDPTAYHQEKQRKLQAARTRTRTRSTGGYSSDSSAGSRASRTSTRSSGSRGRRSSGSGVSAQRQRELDARLAAPKTPPASPASPARRPRARSRGRSPSPSAPLRDATRVDRSAPKACAPRPAARKPPGRAQELLDTSGESLSDLDERLTALQQFLREAKQGGGRPSTAA